MAVKQIPIVHIYIIRNDINDKVYIGQTIDPLQRRFREHINDAKHRVGGCKSMYRRPLLDAINKYGAKHFYISEIETCEGFSLADERERYWISYYNSYGNNGYNATIGGHGFQPYDYNEIKKLIQDGYSTREIVKQLNCYRGTVHKVAKLFGLKISEGDRRKRVLQFDTDGNILRTFDSITDAGIFICNTFQNVKHEDTARKNISRCIIKGLSAYGYVWAYE